jgi:hypothetical protein
MARPFRLARVLRLQREIRRLRRLEADALAARAEALVARARALADARARRAADELRAAAAGPVAALTFQLGRAYDDALADEERGCRLETERVEAALAAKHAELQQARREERKLERLAAAHAGREAEDEARATGVLLDELAIAQHGRAAKERS